MLAWRSNANNLKLPAVFPAQAGTHFDLCDRAVTKTARLKSQWFPACAGMTVRLAGIHFDLCDHAIAKTARLKSQWFPACAGMTTGSLKFKLTAFIFNLNTQS